MRQLFDVIGTGESASVRETYGETSNGYYDNRGMSSRCRRPRDFGPEPGDLPTSSEIEGIAAAANDDPLLLQRLGVVLSQFSTYELAETYLRQAYETHRNRVKPLIQIAQMRSAHGDNVGAFEFARLE